MEMFKGILALALLGVLTAGDAFATSGPNLAVTSSRQGVHVRLSITVEQPAGQSPAAASDMSTGHATGLGSSRPQPIGPPVSGPEAAPAPAPVPHHQGCPAGQHMGVMCTAP
jgi:hypothetical protein